MACVNTLWEPPQMVVLQLRVLFFTHKHNSPSYTHSSFPPLNFLSLTQTMFALTSGHYSCEGQSITHFIITADFAISWQLGCSLEIAVAPPLVWASVSCLRSAVTNNDLADR
ncbi:hypothetical protein PoB_003699700 [Plakobranchus ocellatus]|uniref:Uncharacterized protein n=1 Tax=Plakobranchus ocellatus TaxID=259542 RepID=A0AAV4AT48_9GAST|nr:hypothetical protein PoB_003699700 [Plakobranchus ocellatus]